MSKADCEGTQGTINRYVETVFVELDKPITEEEISSAIKILKRSKTPCTDSLLNEYFIEFSDILKLYLCQLFNIIFEKGLTPSAWSTGIIVPVHKKGDQNDAPNFRGITLLSHISKLFTSVLNNQLLKWNTETDFSVY